MTPQQRQWYSRRIHYLLTGERVQTPPDYAADDTLRNWSEARGWRGAVIDWEGGRALVVRRRYYRSAPDRAGNPSAVVSGRGRIVPFRPHVFHDGSEGEIANWREALMYAVWDFALAREIKPRDRLSRTNAEERRPLLRTKRLAGLLAEIVDDAVIDDAREDF